MARKKKLAMGIAIGLALVLCTIAVVTHKDPTFAHPDRTWAATPITVSCWSAENLEACPELQAEVRNVNRRLGFPMLRYRGGFADTAISMFAGSPTDESVDCSEEGGCFKLKYSRSSRGYTGCDMFLVNTSADRAVEADVIAHELGHCLGLAHDDSPDSIMYPIQSVTEERPPSQISDMDRRALRDTYAR